MLVGRRLFLVDGERFGDPQADPAGAGEIDQLVDLGAVWLGLGGVDDAAGVEGEPKHAGQYAGTLGPLRLSSAASRSMSTSMLRRRRPVLDGVLW